MPVQVLTFGTDCDQAVGAAILGTAITYQNTDLSGDVSRALKVTAALIRKGTVAVVVCTVNPPAPLSVLDLLIKAKDATTYCQFFFYASTQAELAARISDTDRKSADAMGAKGYWYDLSDDDLRDKIEAALNGGGRNA